MTRVRVDKHLPVEALLDEPGCDWSSKMVLAQSI